MPTDEEIVETYFRNYENHKDEDFWAWEELQKRIRTPDEGWRMIHLLVDRAPSLQALGYVGAGPLEDMLYTKPLEFMEMVAATAHDDERLQFALSNVCLDELEEEDHSVWERWMAIRKELDLDAKRAIIYPNRPSDSPTR